MTQKNKESIKTVENGKTNSPQSKKTPAVSSDTTGISCEELKKIADEIKEKKHSESLAKIGYFWTLIWTVYAVISTILLISKGWIDSVASYVLIGMLVVYLLVFVIILAMSHRDKKRSAKQLSYYKKLLAMFKLIANLMFLVISATTLVGVSASGETVVKWVVFILTFITVTVQLGLKIALFVMKIRRKHVGKRYTVTTYRYVNGQSENKKLRQKIKEKTYK